MNSLLNFLNPKKSGAAKAKKSGEFFLEAADDETTSHTTEIVPVEPAPVAATQANESAIVVAESASIAPAPKAAKSSQIKKFKGKGEADVIDAVATVVVPPTAPAEPVPTNFSSDFLSPALSQTPRRRPGPSMAGFMNMAQQIKTK